MSARRWFLLRFRRALTRAHWVKWSNNTKILGRFWRHLVPEAAVHEDITIGMNQAVLKPVSDTHCTLNLLTGRSYEAFGMLRLTR